MIEGLVRKRGGGRRRNRGLARVSRGLGILNEMQWRSPLVIVLAARWLALAGRSARAECGDLTWQLSPPSRSSAPPNPTLLLARGHELRDHPISVDVAQHDERIVVIASLVLLFVAYRNAMRRAFDFIRIR